MASKIASRSIGWVVALASVLIFKGINAVTELDFAQEPNSSIVVRNQPLSLDCAVTGQPTLTVEWLLNGQTISPSEDRQITDSHSLFLPSVLPKRDSGVYQCCASNDYGRICSCPATVTVANVPRFTIVKSPTLVRRGGVFRLECQSDGAVPIPAVLWRRGKEVIMADDRRTILPNGVLQVTQVNGEDEGNYRCFAELDDRRIKSSALSVSVSPSPTGATAATAPSVVGRPPSFVAVPQGQRVLQGETALLECFADGESVRVTWHREDEQPIRTQGVEYLGQGNLQLQGVTIEDDAVYICTAQSLVTGESVQAQAQLVVLVPPTFTVTPSDFFAPLGSTVRFLCEAVGHPTPTVRWYHNGDPPDLSDRLMQKPTGDLLFSHLVKEDMGMVQCVVENEAGRRQIAAKLEIRIVEDALDPPGSIGLVSISPDTVMITWREPPKKGREILAYAVHYKAEGERELQQILNVKPTNAFIGNLRPHTNYSFFMQTWTTEGPSKNSKNYYVVTKQTRPAVAPDFTVASNSPTSVTVNWQPVPLQYRHGVIVQYRITVRTDGLTQDTFVDDVSLREYTVEGLLAGQIYQVSMAAATDKGFGVASRWVTIQTWVLGDSRPPAPQFEVKRLNLTSLVVCPVPQQPSDMNLLGLKLFYAVDDGGGGQEEGPPTSPEPILLPLNATEYIITGLEPETTYIIKLLAYTVFSDGHETVQDITTGSEPGPPSLDPSSPTGLQAVSLSSRIIKLAWQVPVTRQHITSYVIHYWQRNNRSNQQQRIEIDLQRNGTEGELLVRGLDPFTMYEFEFCAMSSPGLGQFCETTAVTTLEDRPSTPPEDVLAKSLDSQAVELQWQPPMEPNGIITHYVILYNEDVSKPEEKWNQQARNGTAHHSTVDGLASDTRYYFKVRAGTQVGEGPPTNAVAAQTLTAKKSASWPWQKALPVGVCLAIVLIVTLLFFILCKRRGIMKTAGNGPGVHHAGSDGTGSGAVCMGYTATNQQDARMYVMNQADAKERHNGFSPMMSVLPQPRNLDTKGGTPLIINGNGPIRHHHHHHYPNGGMVIPSRFPRASGPCSGEPDASSLALLPGSESVTNSDLGEDNSQGKSEASSSSGGFTMYSQDLNHRTPTSAVVPQCCLPSRLPQCSGCCLGTCPQLSDSSTGSYGEPVLSAGSRTSRSPQSPPPPPPSAPYQPAPPQSQSQGRHAAAAAMHTGVNISSGSDSERYSGGRSPPQPASPPTSSGLTKSELTWPRRSGQALSGCQGGGAAGAVGAQDNAETPPVWERQVVEGEERPHSQTTTRDEADVTANGEDTSHDFLTKVLDELSSGSCSTAV